MTSTAPLNADQLDALRELSNIGMGRAASALARILNVEVELSVPTAKFIPIDELLGQINARARQDDIVLTRQAFSHGLDGEAILLFERTLAVPKELSGVAADAPRPYAVDDEEVLEITNIIVGAFFGSLMTPLGITLYFSPPSIVPGTLAGHAERRWDYALLLEISMGTHGQVSNCVLSMVFPETSTDKIGPAVDQLLETL